MTCRDYHVVMSEVRIADLKARLSEHLRSVRKDSRSAFGAAARAFGFEVRGSSAPWLPNVRPEVP